MADGDGTDLCIGVPEMQPETVSMTINPFSSENGLGDPEPMVKRFKLDDTSEHSKEHVSLKQMMLNINRAICLRLDTIETKLETVQNKTKELEEKVDTILNHLVATQNATAKLDGAGNDRVPNIVVGVPNRLTSSPNGNDGSQQQDLSKLYENLGIPQMGPNITLITLNREEDYPEGSWLGDESNPEMRVRVPITPTDLLHIHSNCRTPEKMALTFLDYLFDRETQANSNLSGMGKHGKKQLDPLMIYGVRCHLMSRFTLSEQDWHRIKQNMDSKCRTAFRRKQRGLPLTVKAFRGKSPATGTQQQFIRLSNVSQFPMHDLSSHSDDSLQHSEEAELQIQGENAVLGSHDSVMMSNIAQMIQNPSNGEIQVLHATPEEVAQLQQSHQIQIVQGDHVIGQLRNGHDGEMELQVRVSLPNSNDPHAGGGATLQHMVGGAADALMGEVVGHEDAIHTIIKGEPT